MRHLLAFFLAASAFAQTTTITDTIRTPMNGLFTGTVTVTLNNPAQAQPLYSGNVTLSGWSQTVTVTAGVFVLTLYTNDLITPGGTSYTATYAPSSGTGWKETWIVPTGATTIRALRSTVVPSPLVKFNFSQLNQGGASTGQGVLWNGSAWAPGNLLTDPTTTAGDLVYRGPSSLSRLGIGSTGQVLTVSGGAPTWATPSATGTVASVSVTTANGVSGTVANPTTTPAITLSLGAITPTSVAATSHIWASGTEGACNSTTRGYVVMVRGGSGSADTLRVCAKNANDTYAWTSVMASDTLQVINSGPTATVTSQVRRVYIDPSSVISALTLTLPAAPLDADQVQIYFGGTIANRAAVVTTLSIAPNTGQSINQYSAPVNAFGGDMVSYEYRASTTRWYRIQ